MIVRDFAAAYRHVVFTLTTKLSMWSQLPWLMYGMAHHNKLLAQTCAAKVLAKRRAVADWSLEHNITNAMLQDSSVVAEMERFAAGEPLETLPLLLEWVAKFRFTPVSERWIEGRHAQIYQLLKGRYNAGPAFVAFKDSLLPLTRLLHASPEAYDDLQEAFVQVQHVPQCV